MNINTDKIRIFAHSKMIERRMKRKIIALIFILVFLTFFSLELKAQSDAFFAIKKEQRTGGSNGLMFNGFSSGTGGGFGQQDGLSFGDFAGESLYESKVPVGQGMFVMTATGILYLIAKRRKENK